jgi:hypothetical protein
MDEMYVRMEDKLGARTGDDGDRRATTDISGKIIWFCEDGGDNGCAM